MSTLGKHWTPKRRWAFEIERINQRNADELKFMRETEKPMLEALVRTLKAKGQRT